MQIIERHADPSDTASDIEQIEINLAIQAVRHITYEEPEYNSNGLRICIECEVLIPIARIRANENAVRCIHCQEKIEKENKLYGGRYA